MSDPKHQTSDLQHPNKSSEPNPPGWFEDPKNIAKIVKGLFIACGLLVIVDLFMHKHSYFSFEDWPIFFGVYGFCAYTFIVLSAKGLRVLLKREEDYYDR